MTEETIKQDISHWYLTAPKGIDELAKQLLEQHEAEMVELKRKLLACEQDLRIAYSEIKSLRAHVNYLTD